MSDQEGKSSFDLGKLGEIAGSKRITRRAVVQGAAAAGALAALGPFASACGSSEPDTSASPSTAAPKQGGHIRSAITGGNTKDTLDGQSSYIDAGKKTEQIYEPLLGWTPDSKLELRLAESYDINADGTEYTVKLKSGITFHDGSPVTADAVVYSFQRVLDPKTAALATSHLTARSEEHTSELQSHSLISYDSASLFTSLCSWSQPMSASHTMTVLDPES